MKTKEYFAPLLKWWWLLLIAMITAGVSAYITTRPLPEIYEARTTLVIGRFLSNLNPTQDEINLSQQLAQGYADIAKREPIQQATKKALGVNDLPKYNSRALSGPFMEITVDYSDPKIAQSVANELANQLILLSPANLKQNEQDSTNFVQQQLTDLETKIKQTQSDITKKQAQISTLTSAVLINQAQSELDALDTRLTFLQSIYSNMQATLPQNARNQLSVYESAEMPKIPIGPNKPLIIVVAAIAGLLLAIGAAYAIEALDASVRNIEEASRLLDMPVIGRVSVMANNKKGWTYTDEQPNSGIAEDFRLLRTNLEFFGVDEPVRTVMITSSDLGDGKSTIATNLALIASQGEKSVILVDADFRRPMLADVLEIDGSLGLSDVLSRKVPVKKALIQWKDHPNLCILPAGTLPPNPTELLNSQKMGQVLTEMKGLADLIIIDGPPFIVADASVLAVKVDGVVVVVRTSHSRRSAVIAMREQIQHIGARVLGMVLNQIPGRSSYY
ncbi:MAG TPA: polysaccharide biosynthesis tyrosine autokinase, partial [Anaerolineales bacterium]